MQNWRATQPVDVARLNSAIFLAVLRKFSCIAAICAPVYFGRTLVLAELRAPQLSIGFVLTHVWLYFVTALLAQLRLALVVAPDGPFSRLAYLADRPVRLDQFISRRSA